MLDFKWRSDARAVHQVLAGRRESFDTLVTRYQSLVYHVALSHVGNPSDAEDLAQDAFLKAFRSLDALQEPERFGPWVVTIVRNAARDFLKRKGVRTAYAKSAGEPEPHAPEVEVRETRRVLWRHLEQLEESQRELLVLHYFEGKRTKELAALYGISSAACAKRLQRARQTLAAEVLNSLGMEADRDERRDMRKQVMAGVAGLPVVWNQKAVAAAQSATTASLVAGIAKIAAGVLLAAGATIGGITYISHEEPETPALAAASPPPSASRSAESADAATVETAATEVDPDSGRRSDPNNLGIGEISGVVRDASGQPVPGAEVVIDGMLNDYWRYPDVSEARRTQTADSEGAFLFEQLPAPSYNMATTYVVMAFDSDRGAVASTGLYASGNSKEVELELQPTRTLSGIVTDSNGAPIAGARIYPARKASEEGDESFRGIALRTLSNAEGRFTLRGLSEVPWELVAMAEGYATQRTPFFAPGLDGVTITLERGEALGGSVIDRDTGGPASRVQLLVFDAPEDGSISFSPWNTRLLETGEDGRYTVEHLLPGRYRTSLATLIEDTYVYPPDNVSMVYHELTASNTEAPALEVIRGGALRGRVYDPATGAGLEGVQVTILVNKTIAPAPEWTVTRTDQDGHYRFQGLRDGTHIIYLEQQRNDAREITTGPGDVIENIDFACKNHARVRGTVLTAEGLPSPGVRVRINSMQAGNDLWIASDLRGRFEARALTPVDGLYLYATTNRMRSAIVGPLALTMEGIDGIHLTLDRPLTASIEGVVVDGQGRPMANAQVLVEAEGPVWEYGGNGRADEKGAFAIKRLAAGPYTLQVLPSTQLDWHMGQGTTRVTLAEGQTLKGMRLVHGSGGHTIAGRVIDTRGNPIGQASVWASGANQASAASQADGRFEIPGMEGDGIQISVSHEEFSRETIRDVPPGRTNLEIVLQRNGNVTGRVLRADTGAPIEDFTVAVREQAISYLPAEIARNLGREGKSFRSEDGAFDMTGVKPGEATVIVVAKGFAPDFVTVENVPEGGTLHDVVVRLEPGLTVAGRVSNERGEPVPGAAIYAGSIHSRGSVERNQPDALTAPDGAFTLDSLPDNVRVVTVLHPEYAPGVAPLVWQGKGYGPLDIRLTQGGAVEGKVLVNGEAVVGGRASVRVEFPGEIDAVSEFVPVNADGSYRMDNIQPGAVRVSATYRDELMSRAELREDVELNLQHGETARADFNLRTGSGSVEGHVADANERPLGHSVLVQVDTGEQVFTINAYLDEARNYRATNIPAGRVTVQYPAPAAGRQRFTHDLGEGETVQQDFQIPTGGAIGCEVQYSSPNLVSLVLLLPGSVEVASISSTSLKGLIDQALDFGPGREYPLRLSFNGLEPGPYTVIAVAAVAWTNEGLDTAQVATEVVQLDGTEEVFVPFQF